MRATLPSMPMPPPPRLLPQLALALLLPLPAVAQAVPRPPTGLRCAASTSSSVTLDWMDSSAPGSIHIYDLEAGSTAAKARDFPFASVTVAAPATPSPSLGFGAKATIEELRPSTDYFFKVRAHCSESGLLGCHGGAEQMIAGWSNFSAVIPCTTKAADDEEPPPAPATPVGGGVETMWLEVFRVTENMMPWPDFLANHNTGDLHGDVAFMSRGSGRFFNFSFSPVLPSSSGILKASESASESV